MSSFRVGTSGWQYDDWPGRFYPRDLPRSRWFSYYAAHFDTVEVNATFYRLPEPARFDAWRAQAPPGFVYALKFSRYGSHLKKLKDPEATVGAFVERARRLGERLGPILVQLPPRWHVDPDRLVGFLDVAPPDLSWVLEFRDPSWLCDEIYEVLIGAAAVEDARVLRRDVAGPEPVQ